MNVCFNITSNKKNFGVCPHFATKVYTILAELKNKLFFGPAKMV